MPKALTARNLTPGPDGTVPVQATIPIDGEARDSYNSLEVPIQALIDVLGFLQTKVGSLGDAAALLAKLKTVDGQGSLLDADLLDGRSSEQLLSPASLGFTQVLQGQGYTQLPNGVILQWGTVDFGTAAYTGNQFYRHGFNFPVAFPGAVWSVTLGILSGLTAGTHTSVSCESQTLQGGQMTLVYGANVNTRPVISFFAVGN